MPAIQGGRIRELRKKQNMTLEELAQKIGSSKGYIWELENKPDAKPSAEKLQDVAKALKSTIDFLMAVGDVSEEEANDQVFFRQYKDLGEKKKRKLQTMLELLDDDDENDR